MNKLLASSLCVILASAAHAAGPVSEPGVPGIKLDITRPEAALPGAPAAAIALPQAAAEGLAAPVSAVPGVEAAAAEAEGPAAASQDAEGERAGLDARFDGSASRPGGDEAGFSTPVDFSQAVSEHHRGLLKEALAAHADSVAAFFDLTGQPRPGFLYVSHARDDSPGAATVVTRVIYSMSGHSSRFDERAASVFWLGLDLKTKKIEFFTKEPGAPSVGGPQPVAPSIPLSQDDPRINEQTKDRVRAKTAALGRSGWPGARWSRFPNQALFFARFHLGGSTFGDGYEYTALLPIGRHWMNGETDPNLAKSFWVERRGGQTGQTVYGGPFPIEMSPAQQSWPEHLVAASNELSAYYMPLAGKGSKVIGVGHSADHVVVLVRDQADVAAVKADVEARFPEIASLVEYLPTGDIAPQRVLISPETADKVKARVARMTRLGLIDTLAWTATEPSLGEHAKVSASKHAPGSGDEYNYVALVPSGQSDLFYLHRTGGFAGESVYAGPFAVDPISVQRKLEQILREENAALAPRITTGIGKETVVVRAGSAEDFAAAKEIVARRLPELAGLFTFQAVTGRIVAQADSAGESKTPQTLQKPEWFGAPTFKQAGFFGSSGVYALYADENGNRMRIDAPRPGSPVTVRFFHQDGTGHEPRVVDGSEAFQLSSMLGQVQGRIVLADSTRAAVIALRESLRRIFTGQN